MPGNPLGDLSEVEVLKFSFYDDDREETKKITQYNLEGSKYYPEKEGRHRKQPNTLKQAEVRKDLSEKMTTEKRHE